MFLLDKWDGSSNKEKWSREWDKRWWNSMCRAIEPKQQFKPTKSIKQKWETLWYK